MLQPQLLGPPRLSLAGPICAAQGGCRRRRSKPKPRTIAFPPPPLRRLVSTSLRRLVPRLRPLIILPGGSGSGSGGWFRLGRRRKTATEDLAVVALSLALGGDRLAALTEAWNASSLGQVLGVLAAVMGRGRSRRGDGLQRLAAFLLGVVVCALVCHIRGAAFLGGIQKTGGARRLVRIFLH